MLPFAHSSQSSRKLCCSPRCFQPTSVYPELFKAVGVSYTELISKLIPFPRLLLLSIPPFQLIQSLLPIQSLLLIQSLLPIQSSRPILHRTQQMPYPTPLLRHIPKAKAPL